MPSPITPSPPWRPRPMSPCRSRPESKRPSQPPRASPASWPCFICLPSTRARASGRMDSAAVAAHINELLALPGALALSSTPGASKPPRSRRKYSTATTFLYLGRGIHYAIAREGALKLKEASYVHAEGYPVGELKHGPNALVSDRVPLVVLATVDRALEASVSALRKDPATARRHEERKARTSSPSPTQATREVPALVSRLHRHSARLRVPAAHPRSRPAATLRLLHGARARRRRRPPAQPLQSSRRKIASRNRAT